MRCGVLLLMVLKHGHWTMTRVDRERLEAFEMCK